MTDPKADRPKIRIRFREETGDMEVEVPAEVAGSPAWKSYGEDFLDELMEHAARMAEEEEDEAQDGFSSGPDEEGR